MLKEAERILTEHRRKEIWRYIRATFKKVRKNVYNQTVKTIVIKPTEESKQNEV